MLTGNEYLTRFASVYTEPDNVHFVPTCVEPAWYPLADHRLAGSAIRMGWIGQRCMLPSLEAIEEQLAAVVQRLPGISLRVISDALPRLPSPRLELRPWSSGTEASDLADTDIGISWLCDDLWGQGKCGLKVLQYMAAGLPVVANAVGVHRQMVVHGETGFLADTPAEWAEAVSQLAGDPSLRQKMGSAARRRVEANYNVRQWGPKVARLLRQMVETPSPAQRPIATRQPHEAGDDSRRSRRPNASKAPRWARHGTYS